MHDEMDRSLHLLKMDQHALPYFISYEIKDVNEISIASILGSKPIPWHDQYLPSNAAHQGLANNDFDSSFPRTFVFSLRIAHTN